MVFLDMAQKSKISKKTPREGRFYETDGGVDVCFRLNYTALSRIK